MSWKKELLERTTHPLLPDWFITAKRERISEEEILEKLREECRASLKWQAEQMSIAYEEIEIDGSWVNALREMYEKIYAEIR